MMDNTARHDHAFRLSRNLSGVLVCVKLVSSTIAELQQLDGFSLFEFQRQSVLSCTYPWTLSCFSCLADG